MGSPSLDSIYQNVCKTLEAQGRVESVSKKFSVLRNDEDRAAFALGLLGELDLLPPQKVFAANSKSASDSARLRNEGNKLFLRKDNSGALSLYTQSIVHAPITIEQTKTTCEENKASCDGLCLGFANRSATLFELGKIQECLQDIENAFKNNYPDKLRYKLQERRAKCYQKLKCFKEAEESFVEALDSLSLAEGALEEKRKQMTKEIQDLKGLQNQNEEDHQNETEKKVTPVTPSLPPLSFEQHPCVPCASSALSISYSAEMGRFVEAVRDVDPGDVLLVERPFASVLLPDFFLSHCFKCLKPCVASVPCLHCTTVVFCSVACREAAWVRWHHVECPLLPALLRLRAGKFALLAVRIVVAAVGDEPGGICALRRRTCQLLSEPPGPTLGFDAQGCYRSDTYAPIFHLVGHPERRTVRDMFERAIAAACLAHCLRETSSFFLMPDGGGGGDMGEEMVYNGSCINSADALEAWAGGLILRHLQNLPCNAHEVSEYVRVESQEGHRVAESVEIGAAAYATLSLLNHGCDPSVVRHSADGDAVVLRALRPLRQGQQVLDNYGLHYALHPRGTRKATLRAQYFFDCACEPCVEDWPCYDHLPSTTPIYLCLSCRAPLRCSEDCLSIQCACCSAVTDVLQLRQKLLASSKNFLQQLTTLLAGGERPDAQHLVQHLQLLDARVARPWKEYNDCQETLKQCFNLLGNYYCR